MFKGFSAAVAATLLAGMSGTALAQAAPPAPAPAPAQTTMPNANEIVCERQEVVGSRLAKKKVCMTRAEWADHRLQDRQELERAQKEGRVRGQ